MDEFNDLSLTTPNLSSISITSFLQSTVLSSVQSHSSIDKLAMAEVITSSSQLSVHSHSGVKETSMAEFEEEQEFDRFMRNLSLIQNEQPPLSNQEDTKTPKKNQKKSVKTGEKKRKVGKKTMSQKKNKNKDFEKNSEQVFEQVSRYTKKTLRKFRNQVMKIKKRFAAEILDSEKIKKRQRKSAAKQKKGYENITKNVPMKERLSDRDLLALRNDTSLTVKKR